METRRPEAGFTPGQSELWKQVVELWALAGQRDARRIRALLHPDYAGWDLTRPLPHDRDAAVASVTGDAPKLREYELRPLSVRIYGDRVGVVHYSYSATVAADGRQAEKVSGKWSEIYLREGETWRMISVSGRSDGKS
jgi:hypothetical protein